MARGDDANSSTPNLRPSSKLWGYSKPLTVEQAFARATEAYFDDIREHRVSISVFESDKYAREQVRTVNPALLAAIDGITYANTDLGPKIGRDDPEHIERVKRIQGQYIAYLEKRLQEFLDALTEDELRAYWEISDRMDYEREEEYNRGYS